MPEMEHIICQLERGTVVTKFFQKKSPDKRILSVKRETRQVVWYRPMTRRNVYEGAGMLLLLHSNIVIYRFCLYNVDVKAFLFVLGYLQLI